MKPYLTFILLWIVACTYGQPVRSPSAKKKLDSLYHVLNTTKSDTNKCIIYYIITNFHQNEPDSLLINANMGLRLALVKSYPLGIARGKQILGDYFMKTGNYPVSLKNLLKLP
jgi:hypothetical protein